MRIYAIWSVPEQTFVKWGVNGGGREGYCIHKGKPCFFKTLVLAKSAVQSFDNPGDYEIRKFEEVVA